MKRVMISFFVILMAFIAISITNTHIYASRKTNGRLDSKILWSYNKNANTMIIGSVKSAKSKKLNINKKDYKYWFQRSKKHIYKKGVSRLATPYSFDRDYRYNGKIVYGNISSIKISKDIKVVPPMSYSWEKGIKSIDIPFVEYVGEEAFRNMSLTENVKGGYKLFKCKRIDKSCFRYSIKLEKEEKLYLQKGLEYIGAYAFCGCSFEYVDIPDTVKTIGKGAFSENKRLKKMKLPKGLERIEEDMFYCDKNLETVDIPDSVVQIGWCAFADSGIKNITIPPNVRILGNYDHGYGTDYGIFSNCKALKKVTIESSKIEKVYPGTFVKTPKNVVFVVPAGMAEEYKRTFVEAGLSKNNQFIEKDMKTVDLPIKLSSSSITVKEGFNRRISILNLTGDEGIEWTLDNEEIADVTGSANAKICAKSSGNATITASVNGEKYICKVKVTATDLNDDANELKKLIKKQIKYGATVSTDILNSNEYKWKDGRLIKINWVRKSVYGNIDLNPFTCLESFIVKGEADDVHDYDPYAPMYNYVWSIDANDCSNLKKIVCYEGVLRELHMENANALEEINIKFNRVRTLDLTNLANLRKVNVLYNSELEKIILKGNYSLSTLICEDGNEDDVDNTPNIEELDLTDTNISELDVLDSVRIYR